ncbi:hypothetical protein GCM10010917_27460 [Paenibacillus physcomitrellae]|uniref:Uncharacterized protein n=1 Tax=Paenibacillus physcomitrellae TaxID=1619311 RepID=A0ABQ1GBY4_9BACL|nr:hypothetical protein GCM10010917_27460 [Paenibacillus physcomitrellae]
MQGDIFPGLLEQSHVRQYFVFNTTHGKRGITLLLNKEAIDQYLSGLKKAIHLVFN